MTINAHPPQTFTRLTDEALAELKRVRESTFDRLAGTNPHVDTLRYSLDRIMVVVHEIERRQDAKA